MAEKRKPVYIFLLTKIGNDAGRKTNKIEVFPSSLWEQKYGRGDPRSKYRLRVNGKWWPKEGHTYFWKTEIMAQISKAVNFYTIPKSYTMDKQKKLTPDSVMDLITKKQEGETGDGITDYTYSEGRKAVKAYGDQQATEAVEDAQILPAEAVMAFLSWATCQPGKLILGASQNAAHALQAYEKFCGAQGWHNPREGWEKQIKKVN